jgi:hypothetical protein
VKPGDLRRWISSMPGLADIGDLMLVTEEFEENPASPRWVSFLCNGRHERMTWRWAMLNTEAIDETR